MAASLVYESDIVIARNSGSIDGPRNFFEVMQRIVSFPHKQVQHISMKVIQRNALFAHQEPVIFEMLADEDDDLRRVAVNKVQVLCGARPRFDMENDDFLDHDLIDNDTGGKLIQISLSECFCCFH